MKFINKMVDMFGEGTFDKFVVKSKVGLYLRYMRDQYRVHLEKNPKFECPLTISQMEWKAILHDSEERTL